MDTHFVVDCQNSVVETSAPLAAIVSGEIFLTVAGVRTCMLKSGAGRMFVYKTNELAVQSQQANELNFGEAQRLAASEDCSDVDSANAIADIEDLLDDNFGG